MSGMAVPFHNAERRFGCAFTLGTQSLLPGSEGTANSKVQPYGSAQPFHTSGGEAESIVPQETHRSYSTNFCKGF